MKTKCIYLLAALMTIWVSVGSCTKKEEEHGASKTSEVIKVTVSPASLFLELGKYQRLNVTVLPILRCCCQPGYVVQFRPVCGNCFVRWNCHGCGRGQGCHYGPGRIQAGNLRSHRGRYFLQG